MPIPLRWRRWPEVVERALGFGDPVGALECSTLQNGQYQCIVATSSGRRAYYLINRSAERVAWLSEYHEEASGSAFPPALDDELEHGDRVFGIYLAVERVERSPGPNAQQAIVDAAAVGYDVELSPDIDCDRGHGSSSGWTRLGTTAPSFSTSRPERSPSSSSISSNLESSARPR